MVEDHTMRPECAKEFGKLETYAKVQAEFRLSMEKDIRELKQVNMDMREMLAGHLSRSESVLGRLKVVEDEQRRMNKSIMSLGVKIGSVIAVLQVITQLVLANIGGG